MRKLQRKSNFFIKGRELISILFHSKIDLAEDILKKNDLFKNNIENSVHPYKVAAKKNKLQNEESEGTGK